ncbi:MAG: hypothetical protein GEU98_06985 [Pseudonocardiaceae bacterium]|nr:hypothetical protein [Pseudonocardiaceae bacterium]
MGAVEGIAIAAIGLPLLILTISGFALIEVPYWGGKSTELTRLVSEFNGRNLVTLNGSKLNLPDTIITQVADQLGYSFGAAAIGSRAEGHGRKIKFVKRLN